MAIPNLLKALPQVVSIFLMLTVFFNCSRRVLPTNSDNKAFEISRFKSKSGRTSLCGTILDADSRSTVIPGYITLNGVVAVTEGKFEFLVIPGGYNLTSGLVGKKTETIRRLKLEEADSVIVKIFLTDDNALLHGN